MTRTRTHFRPVALLAGAVAATLLAVLGVSAAATADPIVVLDHDTPDYRLVLTSYDDEYLTADITNHTGADVRWGLAADMMVPGSRTRLWEPTALGDFATLDVPAGTTAHYSLIPYWSGQRLSFYSDVLGTPVLREEFELDGPFTPVDVSMTGDGTFVSMQLGFLPTIAPAVARAGERPYVAVTGMPDGVYDVYLTPAADVLSLYDFQALWEPVATSVLVASDVASTGGALALTFEVPAGTVPGEYGITIGDPDTNWWPVGPPLTQLDQEALRSTNLVIEAGQPRSQTDGTGVVTPLDQYGQMPVSLSFAGVSVPGTTNVVTTPAGPDPVGFQAAGGSYYEISTTAEFEEARVCLPYDTSLWVEEDGLWQDIRLFHHDGVGWQQLEDDPDATPEFGTVCGITSSFSPFVAGIPDPAPVFWPFEGFLAPVSNTAVNEEFAGSIVPFRFRVGENRGLDILAGSPTSQRVNCTTRAPIGSPEAAKSALRQELTYVRASNTYWYFWQTSTSWAGQCRVFTMTLDDGSVHTAFFKIQKLTLGKLLKTLLKAY